MVLNVLLVVDVVIGTIMVIRTIGRGYEIFVVGIIILPSVGATVHIMVNSNFVKAPIVIVLPYIMFLLSSVLYLLVLSMVLLFLVIYVYVIQSSEKTEIKQKTQSCIMKKKQGE